MFTNMNKLLERYLTDLVEPECKKSDIKQFTIQRSEITGKLSIDINKPVYLIPFINTEHVQFVEHGSNRFRDSTNFIFEYNEFLDETKRNVIFYHGKYYLAFNPSSEIQKFYHKFFDSNDSISMFFKYEGENDVFHGLEIITEPFTRIMFNNGPIAKLNIVEDQANTEFTRFIANSDKIRKTLNVKDMPDYDGYTAIKLTYNLAREIPNSYRIGNAYVHKVSDDEVYLIYNDLDQLNIMGFIITITGSFAVIRNDPLVVNTNKENSVAYDFITTFYDVKCDEKYKDDPDRKHLVDPYEFDPAIDCEY